MFSVGVTDASGKAASAALTLVVLAASGSPQVFYTDIIAGPTTGGENGLGCYLSIFGINLVEQVTIGGVPVANYRSLGPAIVAPKFNPPLQQLVVQVGPVPTGTIAVGGVDSGITFTAQPGPIYFVDPVNGNDSNDGTIGRPFQHIQTSSGGGALKGKVPGTYVVCRAGTYSTLGLNSRLVQFYTFGGTAPTGGAGAGYFTITSYPGEVAQFAAPAGSKGGIHGSNDYVCPYVAISNLHISGDPTATDGPVDFQSDSNYWRVVNCELGPWLATNSAESGGIAGNGTGIKVYGNYIHDITGTAQETHGIYFDSSNHTATNCEAAWNWIVNMKGGSAYQCYNGSGPATPFTGMTVHHNYLDTAAKYGINFADASQSCAAWDNVVVNMSSYALRTNNLMGTPAVSFVHNTIVGCAYPYGNSDGSSIASGYVEIKNNILANPKSGWVYNGGTISAVAFANNLYFDSAGKQKAKYSGDATGIYGDPKFASTTDYHLQAGSPAIGAGAVGLHQAVPTDLDSKPRPVPPSIGAYEN